MDVTLKKRLVKPDLLYFPIEKKILHYCKTILHNG